MSKKSFKIDKSLVLRPQTVAPSSPEEGEIYLDASFGYRKFENGFWSELGGGSGGINYIPSSDAEQGIGDWVTYADAAGVAPVDGIDGSPNITLTLDSVTPLRGLSSFLLTKDAANRQGEGVSIPFSIDKQDKDSALYISFDLEASANYVTDDILVFVYDVDNTSLLTPIRSGNNKRFTGLFYATDSVNYRLIIHIATTNANAYTLKFDNVIVGPDKLVDQKISTEWADIEGSVVGTASGTLAAGTGGGALWVAEWKREGSDILFRYKFRRGTSGTSDVTGAYIFPIPSGITLDGSSYTAVGSGNVTVVGSATPVARLTAKVYGSGIILDRSDAALLSGGDGILYNNANIVSFSGRAKVTEWANQSAVLSTTEMLNKGLQVEATGGTTTLTNATTATLVYSTEDLDTHGAYNASTGIFTAPYKMRVMVNAGMQSGIVPLALGSDWSFNLEKNSVLYRQFDFHDYTTSGGVSARMMVHGSVDVSLDAGDTLRVRFTNNSGTSTAMSGGVEANYLNIQQIFDPTVFSVHGKTELVEASNSTLSNYTITAGTWGDLTSIALTPGEWDIYAQVVYYSNGVTTTTALNMGVANTSGATISPSLFGVNRVAETKSNASGSADTASVIYSGVIVNSNETWYLKSNVQTSITNLQVVYKISARRIK